MTGWDTGEGTMADGTRYRHTSFLFDAELIGGHVHVKVRAATRIPSAQVDHSRGLCGTLVMEPAEWLLLRETFIRTADQFFMVREDERNAVVVGAGPMSFHDGQQFIELAGWPE